MVKRIFLDRCGATAVEFALVAPVVLVLFMTTVEVGRALWIRASMQFAVEEASRYVMVNTGDCNSTAETQAANEITEFDSASVTFTATQSITGTVTFCEISATYNFSVIVPIVPFSATFSAKSKVPIGST